MSYRDRRCPGCTSPRSLLLRPSSAASVASVCWGRARGIEYLRPNTTEREEINRIIMDELVYGTFKPEAVACHQRVIARLKDEGCDAVVLGCTEIPLIINDSNSPLPTLDSTRLLARAALRRAVRAEDDVLDREHSSTASS